MRNNINISKKQNILYNKKFLYLNNKFNNDLKTYKKKHILIAKKTSGSPKTSTSLQ